LGKSGIVHSEEDGKLFGVIGEVSNGLEAVQMVLEKT